MRRRTLALREPRLEALREYRPARRVVAGATDRLKLPRVEEAPYLVVNFVRRQGAVLWTQGNDRTDAGVALMIALGSLSPWALG